MATLPPQRQTHRPASAAARSHAVAYAQHHPPVLAPGNWYWQDEDKSWVPYPPEMSARLDHGVLTGLSFVEFQLRSPQGKAVTYRVVLPQRGGKQGTLIYNNKTSQIEWRFALPIYVIPHPPYQTNLKTARSRPVQRVGAVPYHYTSWVPYSPYTRADLPADQPPPEQHPMGSIVEVLPREVLMEIVFSLGHSCGVRKPAYEIDGEETNRAYMLAFTLCVLDLVCKAFHTPSQATGGLSLTEYVAREWCRLLQPSPSKKMDHNKRDYGRRSWKEQLMWMDPETWTRDEQAKDCLHRIAFQKEGRDIYSHVKADRDKATRVILEKWHSVDSGLEEHYARMGNQPACFTGEGMVLVANKQRKRVDEIKEGDSVVTEAGRLRKVAWVQRRPVQAVRNMITIEGVRLTPGHPILWKGEWTHPFDIAPMQEQYVDMLYNFELQLDDDEVRPRANDHSVIINDLVVCTLGKDCGQIIRSSCPDADKKYGTGYSFHQTH